MAAHTVLTIAVIFYFLYALLNKKLRFFNKTPVDDTTLHKAFVRELFKDITTFGITADGYCHRNRIKNLIHSIIVK